MFTAYKPHAGNETEFTCIIFTLSDDWKAGFAAGEQAQQFSV